jgi:hypothetical protein
MLSNGDKEELELMYEAEMLGVEGSDWRLTLTQEEKEHVARIEDEYEKIRRKK